MPIRKKKTADDKPKPKPKHKPKPKPEPVPDPLVETVGNEGFNNPNSAQGY